MASTESRLEAEASVIRAADIAAQRFTVGRKGYEQDEVRAYLRSLAETVSRLQGEVDWYRARGEHIERRSGEAQEDAYTRLSRSFTEVVRAADDAAKRVLASAEEEGRLTIASVRDRTNAMVVQAQEDAESILTAAREEAGGLVQEARELRDAADRALNEAEAARRTVEAAREAAEPAPQPAQNVGSFSPPEDWKDAIWASPGSAAPDEPEAVPPNGVEPADGSASDSPEDDASPAPTASAPLEAPPSAETPSGDGEELPSMFVSDDSFWAADDLPVPAHDEPWASNGHAVAPGPNPSPVEPEDLDLKLDGSLFDLFEDPED